MKILLTIVIIVCAAGVSYTPNIVVTPYLIPKAQNPLGTISHQVQPTYGMGRLYCPWTEPIYIHDPYLDVTWKNGRWVEDPNKTWIKCGILRNADAITPDKSIYRCGWCGRKFTREGLKVP